MKIVYSHFPHELVPGVERKAGERCSHYRKLPEDARTELATTAVALARSHAPDVIERWRAALDEVEKDPWGYIKSTIDDPDWAAFNEAPTPWVWARNALDAYARIRTAEVALGRCTESTPHSEFQVRPMEAGHLNRARKLAEAILDEARGRLEEYAAEVQGGRSRRDWRKHAEDQLFDETVEAGLSDRAAAAVACQLVAAAAKELPAEHRNVMKRRAEAARKRAERRRKG